MNTKVFKNASLGLLLSAALLAAPVGATELKYATFRPPTSTAMTKAVVPFLEAVERETGGDLSFRVYPSGQLGSIRTTLSSVRNGVADSALVIPIFLRGELPHVALVGDLLFFGEDPAAITGATLETLHFHCPECVKEYAEQNAVTLAAFATTAYNVQCATEARSLDDLKGKKIRVAGGAQNRVVKAMGGVGVQVAPPKIVEAMQRGQIDCALAPLAWLNQFSLKDGTKYIIEAPLGIIRGPDIFAVNKGVWEGLSRSQKAAIYKHLPTGVANTVMVAYYGDDENALKAALDRGAELTKGGPEFDRLVEKLKETELNLLLKSARERGISNAQRIVDDHLRLLEKWHGLASKFGQDPEKFAQVLWEEVYSKLPY